MQASSELTYSHEWIYELENKLHWQLYWHQLNLILNTSETSKHETIVEVGIGSGTVSNYLKRKGFNITTADIDENKKPDIIVNIAEDELPDGDVYLAFEILEHIPVDGVIKFLQKLKEKQVKQLLFSIPHAYKTYLYCDIWLPYFGEKSIHIGRKRNYINSVNHHWEVGINGITLKKIEIMLNENGYGLEYNYRYRNHEFCIAKLITK